MNKNKKQNELNMFSLQNKESGFSVSDNYFDTLEKTVLTNLSTSKFPKENGFKVSNNYFSELESKIIENTSNSNKKTKVVSINKQFIRIATGIAAAVLLFITLNYNTNSKTTLDSLSESDFEYWLDINSLENNDITAILENDIIKDIDFSFANIDDNNIEDYLTDLELTSILNE